MKITLEIHINDLGKISALLDHYAPDDPVTKHVDRLFMAANTMPFEIISIDRTKK